MATTATTLGPIALATYHWLRRNERMSGGGIKVGVYFYAGGKEKIQFHTSMSKAQ